VATLIALCSLMDLNLSLDSIQLAIRDLGGIELLINILETKDIQCQVNASEFSPIETTARVTFSSD